MNAPWYNPISYAWIPGTVFGCLAGLWGSLAGQLAARGKGRTLVVGGGVALLVVAATCLIAAVVAFLRGQPYGIWYGLGLPGLLGMILLPMRLPIVVAQYRQAEERKMAAEDLSS